MNGLANTPQDAKLNMNDVSFPYRMKMDIFNLHAQGRPGTNVLFSGKGNLAYVPIPKNACTTVKLAFFQLLNDKEFTGAFNNIHGKFSYAAVDFERFAADDEHFKFVVIRDPVERFVSAYNNRVKMYRELSKGWFESFSPNVQEIFAAFEARSLTFNPEIGEFANHIEDYIELNHTIRHHFIPQHNFFHSRLDVFDRVYNMGQLPELARDLEARTGEPVNFRSVQETKGLKNPARVEDLTAQELARVKAFYQEDYRLLAAYL
jgi:hypothetical protein